MCTPSSTALSQGWPVPLVLRDGFNRSSAPESAAPVIHGCALAAAAERRCDGWNRTSCSGHARFSVCTSSGEQAVRFRAWAWRRDGAWYPMAGTNVQYQWAVPGRHRCMWWHPWAWCEVTHPRGRKGPILNGDREDMMFGTPHVHIVTLD